MNCRLKEMGFFFFSLPDCLKFSSSLFGPGGCLTSSHTALTASWSAMEVPGTGTFCWPGSSWKLYLGVLCLGPAWRIYSPAWFVCLLTLPAGCIFPLRCAGVGIYMMLLSNTNLSVWLYWQKCFWWCGFFKIAHFVRKTLGCDFTWCHAAATVRDRRSSWEGI